MHWGQWLIDLVVIALSLIRALVPLPLVSGHALFLSYALLTVPSVVVRTSAALVLLEVIYLKIFIWQATTLTVITPPHSKLQHEAG